MGDQKVDKQSELLHGLAAALPKTAILTDPAALLVYAHDSSHMTGGKPLAVVLPESAEQISLVIKLCNAAGVAVVCRGAGTGLSGGALPSAGAIVLSLARMNSLGQCNSTGRLIKVEAGVVNDEVSRQAAADGLQFAPDPSSQTVATIGGNVAENAGGPHCMRHGCTLQNLLQVDWIDAQGNQQSSGRGLAVERGFHLTSLLCGSEGTLGVVSSALLKLVPEQPAVTTLLVFFPEITDATSSVVTLLKAGLFPVAVEIVDQAMLVAIEAAFGFGFPTDVGAAMIAEFCGQPEEVLEDGQRATEILSLCGAREVRQAADANERLQLWKCRKKAFGAVGRLAPCYVTMDVVVPLGKLSVLVQEIQTIRNTFNVDIATVFHAGDGNLHPGVHYDDLDPDLTRRANEAADEIIHAALRLGGSATGEHGTGLEKKHSVPWQIDATTARLLLSIKHVFNPQELLNPGKIHPDPNSSFAPIPAHPTEISFAWDSLTVSAPASVSIADIQQQALARGLCLPVGVFTETTSTGPGIGSGGTVAELVAHLLPGVPMLAAGTARDYLLEVWATTRAGEPFHTGAPVFKNVAGYGLGQALCGSGNKYVTFQAATFQLRPIAESTAIWKFSAELTEPKLTEVLGELTALLVSWDDGLGSPLCLINRQTGGESATPNWELVFVASGRDRQWSLGKFNQELTTTSCAAGLNFIKHHKVTFARSAELLNTEWFPSWALGSPDWTCLASNFASAQNAMPAGIFSDGPGAVWVSNPRSLWVPQATEGAAPWHVDQVFREGRYLPAPIDDPNVSQTLLAELKKIFEPDSGNTTGGAE